MAPSHVLDAGLCSGYMPKTGASVEEAITAAVRHAHEVGQTVVVLHNDRGFAVNQWDGVTSAIKRWNKKFEL